MTEFEVVVVGGGIVGLWTAWHLAKRNKKVALVEQFKLMHSEGSSHGRSRLMKMSHRKPHCADLVPESYRLWDQLEEESRNRLVWPTGHLSVVDASSTSTLSRDLADVMLQRRIAFEYLPSVTSSERLFGGKLSFGEGFESYFEPNGKVLLANECRRALLEELKKSGVVLMEETKMVRLQHVTDSHVVMHASTSSGDVKLTSRASVLCCGVWINQVLAPTNLKLDLKPCKVVSYYWKEKEIGCYSRSSGFPPLMIYCGQYHVYSIPSDDYPGYLKICYHVRHVIDPSSRSRLSEDQEREERARLEEMREIVRRHFTKIDADAAPISEECKQTVTPDSNFIISRHPNHKNIIIGAGFSGHGFGVAPSIGRILSDMSLVTGGRCHDEEARNFPLQRAHVIRSKV